MVSWGHPSEYFHNIGFKGSVFQRLPKLFSVARAVERLYFLKHIMWIDTKAKYLRITDMKNSENDWASITEVDINGDISSPLPLPIS